MIVNRSSWQAHRDVPFEHAPCQSPLNTKRNQQYKDATPFPGEDPGNEVESRCRAISHDVMAAMFAFHPKMKFPPLLLM